MVRQATRVSMQKKLIRGDVEHADSSTGQPLATHATWEFSVLTKGSAPGSLAAGHGCIFSYRIIENTLEKTCCLWPVLSTTYLNDLFYYKTEPCIHFLNLILIILHIFSSWPLLFGASDKSHIVCRMMSYIKSSVKVKILFSSLGCLLTVFSHI